MVEPPWKTREDFQVIGGPLGSGSYGTVWKALHSVDNSLYAIKQVFIDKTLRHFDGNVGKLFAEVTLLQQINSQNIVRYHTCWLEGPDVHTLPQEATRNPPEFGSSGPPPPEKRFMFIQMELCDSTLKEWLTINPLLETRISEIPQILIQLTTALKTIHQLNIIHRDLKPDNIFSKTNTILNETTTWKIGDFGLSKRALEEHELDGTTSIAGCLVYRSPDEQNSQKSDVYSLGLIFLEILHPSLSNKNFQLLFFNLREYSQTINHNHEVQKLISSTFPKECDIVCQMLNPDLDNRLNAQEVLDLLILEPILKPIKVSCDQKNPLANTAKHFPGKLRDWQPKPNLRRHRSDQHQSTTSEPYWFDIGNPTNNFVGREVELERLRTNFEENRFLVVISGLGGIGKSELVRYFAQMVYQEIHGSCIWLRGENESTLKRSVEELAEEVDTKKDPNIWTMFKQIYQKLKDIPILLIIDNVDTVNTAVENLIRSFRKLPPDSEHPFIIITTRNRDVISLTGGEFIELKVFDDIDAIKLVTNSLSKINQEDAEDLCKVLENFPLALQQAICYIQQRQKTSQIPFGISDYLELFTKQRKKIMDFKLSLIDHDYSLTTLTAWEISFDSIKSDDKLGSIAEEFFNTWVYSLDPDGEELQFVVDFIRSVNTIKSGDKKIFKNERNKSKEFDEKEIDIIDDCRPIAQAIQFIRNYSMCNVDLRYRIGKDIQFVTIHRLVQEVVRVSKSNSDEVEWLLEFGKVLMDLCNTDWNSPVEFPTKKRIVLNTWEFISKHDQLIGDLKELIVQVCDSGVYLPIYSKEFLIKTHLLLQRVLGDEDFATMVLEYHYCYLALAADIRFQPFETDSETNTSIKLVPERAETNPFKIVQLTELFKRQILILGHEHKWTRRTLELLTRNITKRPFGPSGDIELENAVEFLLKLIESYQISNSKSSKLSVIQELRVLCVVGKILEEFLAAENPTDLIKFAQNILITFKEHNYNPNPYTYVFKYIAYFIADVINEPNESEMFLENISQSLDLSSNHLLLLRTTNEQELRRLNQTLINGLCRIAPVSVLNKIIMDLLNPASQEINVRGLNSILHTFDFRKRFELISNYGKKALIFCFLLCEQDRFDIANSMIATARYAESLIWNANLYQDSIEMSQDILPLFKFSNEYWQNPSVIISWVDDINDRIRNLDLNFYSNDLLIISKSAFLLQHGLLSDVMDSGDYHNFVTRILEISNTQVLKQIGREILKCYKSSHVSFTSLGFLCQTIESIANCIWKQSDHECWQSFIQMSIVPLERHGFNTYLKSIMARHISKVVSKIDDIPTPVFVWAFLFQLTNHMNLADSNCEIMIKEIVQLLTASEEDPIFEIGLQIAEICENKIQSRFRQLNYWYCFYYLGVIAESLRKIGKLEEDLTLFKIALNLTHSDSKQDIVNKEIEEIKTHIISNYKTRPNWDIVIKVLCNLLCQFLQYSFNKDTVIYIIISSTIDEMLRENKFHEIVILSDCLLEMISTHGYETHAITKALSLCGVLGIINRIRLDEDCEFKHIKLYEAGLKFGKYPDTKILIEKEITKIISGFISTANSDQILQVQILEAEKIFLFVLQYGPESNDNFSLLLKILEYHLTTENIKSMYMFGVAISFIEKSKLKLETLCLEALNLTIEYLTKVCLDNLEKVRRVFITLYRFPTSEFNNRPKFYTDLTELCSKYKLKLKDGIYEDSDYTSD